MADTRAARSGPSVERPCRAIGRAGAVPDPRYAVEDALRLHRATPLSDHREIETYTWDVLPAHLKSGDIVDYGCRELEFAEGELKG